MRKSTLFCVELPRHDTGTYYANFYPHIFTVRCYDKNATALVAEVVEDPAGEYWAWWDKVRESFVFIYPAEGLVEMCFAYGSKPETDKGRGWKMRVSVTILREAGPEETDLRVKKPVPA